MLWGGGEEGQVQSFSGVGKVNEERAFFGIQQTRLMKIQTCTERANIHISPGQMG
jgi:hypothetical protein